jgi:murein L,D-transpeptidase YafK
MQPLSEGIIADLVSRNMAKGSPILVRIFKEESELEVVGGK